MKKAILIAVAVIFSILTINIIFGFSTGDFIKHMPKQGNKTGSIICIAAMGAVSLAASTGSIMKLIRKK